MRHSINRSARLNKLTPAQLEEINKARSTLGLTTITPKLRLCLSCDRKFLSETNGMRICLSCKSKQDVSGSFYELIQD